MTTLGIRRGRGLPALDTPLRSVMAQAVSDTGLTSAEIARRAGLDKSTVSAVLSGRRTGLIDTWDLILTASGVTLTARFPEPTP